LLTQIRTDTLHLLAASRVVDLGFPYFAGMPGGANHAAYEFALVRKHGDHLRDGGVSNASETFTMTGHTGTHFDALGHVSEGGRLAGGLDAAATQAGGRLSALGMETVAPVVCRGVLLDLAAACGVESLPAAYEVTPDDCARAEAQSEMRVQPGDALLLRTGWGRHWGDAERYAGRRGGMPGLGLAASEWLATRGVRLVASDTLTFEVVRPGSGARPVHAHLLVRSGIHILEALNLEPLAGETAPFLFVAAPLPLVGATGSPVRPLALFPPASLSTHTGGAA